MIRLTIWGEREESSKIGGRENHIPPPMVGDGAGWKGPFLTGGGDRTPRSRERQKKDHTRQERKDNPEYEANRREEK